MKRKLLLAALCVVGALGMRAQTDVTSTYLTNADFEGEYESYAKPSGDRDIYQPNGWTISYKDGKKDDMTSLNPSTPQWNQFENKPQPTNGGNNVYWIRFRWGQSQTLTLSQETSTDLPAGTYALSVDAYSDDNTGTATISVAGTEQTVRTNGEWANYKILFTLASAQKVTVSLQYRNETENDPATTAFDNVRLLSLSEEPTDMLLKNELGGTAADLSDFNVCDGDYTLEVTGTAGTEITIAADNISYTPEATGTVRFVKKDGIVYVYEGSIYKTAVPSAKAAYTYATIDESSVTGDNNLLKNGDFSINGNQISDGKWDLGEPWEFSKGTANIRVEDHILFWRGTENDHYFSQPISLKPHKGYKVFLKQIGSDNAHANFNIGIGNAVGDYSYMSTQMRLGKDQDGLHNAELGTSNISETTPAYFTFRNTQTNTASSGNDPFAKFGWIALVESDKFPITGAESASYIYGTAYAPASSKAAYLTAKQEAIAVLEDDAYAVVTGEERAALQALVDATVENNDNAYNTATNDIYAAKDAFTAAPQHYQAFIDARANAQAIVTEQVVQALKYASAEKKAFLTAEAKNATDADERVAAMESNIRALYESHAMAEGVKDAVDMTDKITNPKAESAVASPWTIVKGGNSEGNIDVKSTEPWMDGSDNATHKYFDGGNWGANSWDVSLEQEITLAPGKYLLTVTARAASDVTFSLYAGENKAAIPAIGAEGGVFNRGWNDQSVEFDVEKTGTVKIGVQGVTSVIHNWMSFSNFRLVRLEEVEMATETEYKALNNAVLENEKKTLGFNQGEYAPYANVEALTALEEAKAINQEEENTKAYIEALTKAVATWTANETDVDAIYNGLFATVTPGANYPEGWVRTNAWGQMESNISGTYATAYYNQPGSMQYGNQGLYTMPLAANTWYKLTFAYRSHPSNGNTGMTVSVLNEKEEGLVATHFDANPSQTDWKEVEQIFQTGTAGNYVLTLANGGNTWLTNVSLTKSAESTATMSVKAGKWGTFAAPFEVTIPEGVKAYKVTGVENEQIVKKEVEETIPANTPVVLLNETEEDVEETLAGVGIPESETVTEGLLTGIYQEGADIPADCYVLQTQGEKQAFYHAKDGFAGKGVANRCYLTMPTSNAPLRAIFLDSEEGTTGIEAAETAEDENAPLYNLAGQKVDAGYKGIVIKKGKTMLKK